MVRTCEEFLFGPVTPKDHRNEDDDPSVLRPHAESNDVGGGAAGECDQRQLQRKGHLTLRCPTKCLTSNSSSFGVLVSFFKKTVFFLETFTFFSFDWTPD